MGLKDISEEREEIEDTIKRLSALEDKSPEAAKTAREISMKLKKELQEKKEMENLIRILNSIPQQELPPGYEEQLHAKLVKAEEEQSAPVATLLNTVRDWFSLVGRRSFWKPVPVAVLSLVVVALVSVFYLSRKPVPGPAIGGVQVVRAVPASAEKYLTGRTCSAVKLDRASVLRFNFQAARGVDGVEFEIVLPEGLCLVNEGKEDKIICWQGDLQEGKNMVLLRVKGVKEGNWEVKGSVQKGNAVKTLKKKISVVKT